MAKPRKESVSQEDKILMDIEKFGWTVVQVEGTDYLPTFAYTIGLYKNYNHPEIIAFGLDMDTLFETLNDIGEEVKSGKIFTRKKNYPELFEESRTEFLKVDPENIEDYLGYAVDFYEEDAFSVLELIWTDDNDAFPWDANYDENFQFSQPLLDRNMGFKFMEEKNLKVFVARQFLKNDASITQVVHDEEGNWHFHTSDSGPKDMESITLEQVVQTDASLNELFSLDYGEEAKREPKDNAWEKIQL